MKKLLLFCILSFKLSEGKSQINKQVEFIDKVAKPIKPKKDALLFERKEDSSFSLNNEFKTFYCLYKSTKELKHVFLYYPKQGKKEMFYGYYFYNNELVKVKVIKLHSCRKCFADYYFSKGELIYKNENSVTFPVDQIWEDVKRFKEEVSDYLRESK